MHSTRIRLLYDWIDQRTGLRSLLNRVCNEPIPGGARWAYIFGSGLVCALFIQLLTGIALALYYVPAAGLAHGTVAYLTKQVWSGSFIRGVHAYGSQLIVLLLVAHLIQTFVFGAFKNRREVLWLSGVCLSLLLAGMAFTGYLLPWDQRSYFATVVGTNVIAEVPVIGPTLKRILRGGDGMGTLTLSRFYVLHVIVLPLAILALATLHLLLFRRAGPAGPPQDELAKPLPPAGPFYPKQLLMDICFATGLALGLAAFAHFVPVPLGPEANPSSAHYIPRPEWYFLPLFQWLKYWQGRGLVVGVVVVPSLVFMLLAGVPFIDRQHSRRARKRPFITSVFVTFLMTLFMLGVLSVWDDHRDGKVRLQLAKQSRETEQYMKQPFTPLPATLPAIARPSPEALAGQQVFKDRQCIFCHGEGATGTPAAPRLIGVAEEFTAEELEQLIRHPNAKMTAGKMPPFQGSDNDLYAVVAYLQTLQ